jgi:hypothetical protein
LWATEKPFAAVIPADAGIQHISGCLIESGMTNYLVAGTTKQLNRVIISSVQ